MVAKRAFSVASRDKVSLSKITVVQMGTSRLHPFVHSSVHTCTMNLNEDIQAIINFESFIHVVITACDVSFCLLPLNEYQDKKRNLLLRKCLITFGVCIEQA